MLVPGKSSSSHHVMWLCKFCRLGLCKASLLCTVANPTQSHRKLYTTHNMLQWCTGCANLRQTDQVANIVPESPTICNQPSHLLQAIWFDLSKPSTYTQRYFTITSSTVTIPFHYTFCHPCCNRHIWPPVHNETGGHDFGKFDCIFRFPPKLWE